MEIKRFDDGLRYVETFFTVGGKKVKFISYATNVEETDEHLLERHRGQVDLGGRTLVQREVLNDTGLADNAPEEAKQRHREHMYFLKSLL